MATTKLLIRENKINSDGKCVIYIRYTHNEKSFLISTSEKIAPELWDAKNQKVKKAYRGFTSLNDTLESKVEEVNLIARVAKQQKIDPTVEYVKEKLAATQEGAGREGAAAEPVQLDFFTLYEQFLVETDAQKAKSTIIQHRTTISHLKNFQEAKKYKISFERLDTAFNEKFLHYLIKDKNFGNNTVGKYIKNLKAFLNWATDKGYNATLHHRKFKKPKAAVSIIYLTRKELDLIFGFDLSKKKKLERVRDLFVFECATGLRYSDLCNLKLENIKNDYLDFTTIKTGDRLLVPLTNYARQILTKYEGAIPKAISSVKMNKYLKELGQVCGIDESIQQVKISGGKRTEKAVPKYTLITTHTARRTFITQSLERGIRPEVIMKITGHKDIKTMMKYVKITDNVVRSEMLKAWDS